jgi:RNA polymerase sigma factor (sigma-70 family)
MVATLTRLFGVHNLALAEDVVQDAFCRALEVWPLRGVPENPSAWLMTTAKNRALDVLRRHRTARTFAPELGRLLDSEWTLAPAVEELFAADAIEDGVLRMMFSCCHPRLPEQAQVALILNILCGFSADEIASAFIGNRAAITKRISRAKKVLAGSKRLFDTAAPADVSARLPAVQRALYLLFNEGYHSASAGKAVRFELCHEAMRLTAELLKHPCGRTPATLALAALMCLCAARLPARTDAGGHLVALSGQDRALWDPKRVAEGLRLLELSASGATLTPYHVEAAIAALHVTARRGKNSNNDNDWDTDWEAIVSLYDTLMAIEPSPIVALNRAIAVAQRDGPERGLEAIDGIENCDCLAGYPLYSATIAELELRRGRHEVARAYFRAARGLARNPMQRRFLDARADACGRADAGQGIACEDVRALIAFRNHLDSDGRTEP